MNAEEFINTRKREVGGFMMVSYTVAKSAIDIARLEVPEMARRVIAERKRQIEIEHYSPLQDDAYYSGQLSLAASCYATPPNNRRLYSYWDGKKEIKIDNSWPPDFDPEMYKPEKDHSIQERLKTLAKAGALIQAEMERLKRLEDKK